ncbi:MAG: histidine ammonia-lyase [Theionarchaea archaeon]|nr:histidine ammonia-lyase [Theionarchaea archaeon]MBU7000957.1 histidine ammonia-lyase [Theionarchaea archaeon]MBU7021102.1 histidine ammonia-lyase [Theionarchaea archaeon]MBU7033828.1 histidine ammonia-lyase [Theionarchaea archaeon]MBU7039904.1 histidine ammonia-lyase [Theionarchaea archaeon]
MDEKVVIDGEHLAVEQVVNVARHHWNTALDPAARTKMEVTEKAVQEIVERDEPVYGINTGFGPLRDTKIDRKEVGRLQVNLIRSHSVGTGDPFPEEVVRAAMLIRANTIAKGYSGARTTVVETLLQMLNKDVTPFVPEKGSLGASGDLAPLSHLALVMVGEGEAYHKGERMTGQEAMEKAGILPLQLKAKEGLAINNGATFTAGIAALAVSDAEALIKSAVLAAALSFEAFKVTSKAFDERIHQLRPHEGQIRIARHIRDLTRGSKIIDSMEKKVQDDYSVRCFPQVLGSSLDAIEYVHHIVETEINSATDNPLIIDEYPISGGNFHGQPLALAMDFLGIAVSEIGNISERHTAKLVDSHHSDGLPIFLIPKGKEGLHSGLMIAQYTAAALVSENKVLSHPACVDSIPTSANAEDHVSMSTIAARKAREIIKNTETITGIEILCAAQGVDLRKNEGFSSDDLGAGSRGVYDMTRQHIPFLEEDRYLYPEVEEMRNLVHQRILIKKTSQFWEF